MADGKGCMSNDRPPVLRIRMRRPSAHLAFRAADDYERAATFDLMDRGDRNRALLRAVLLNWLALALTVVAVLAGLATAMMVFSWVA